MTTRLRDAGRDDHLDFNAGQGTPPDRMLRSGEPTTVAANLLVEGTLIEAEVLDELVLPDGSRLTYADARRNIVTRGVDLNRLVGRHFLIGDVECLGQRFCEPCAHLEPLTQPGTLRGLIHRGGLRADILTGGTIAPGQTLT